MDESLGKILYLIAPLRFRHIVLIKNGIQQAQSSAFIIFII